MFLGSGRTPFKVVQSVRTEDPNVWNEDPSVWSHDRTVHFGQTVVEEKDHRSPFP